MGILDNPTAEQLDILQTINDLPEEAVARIVAETDEGKRDIQYRFEKFHQANPGVYAALVDMARATIKRGVKCPGIGCLWEVLRWEALMGQTVGDEFYKLNDNYRSRYARLIMEQEPDLDGIFETRTLRSPGSATTP